MKKLTIWFLIIATITMFFNVAKEGKLGHRMQIAFFPHIGRVQGNGSIEFTKAHDGHFYIQVQVNNQNIMFLLDTGATDTMLLPKDAARAGITPDGMYGLRRYETANGIIEVGITRVAQMKVGNFLIHNLQVAVTSNSMPCSILGMNFLKHFNFTVQGDKFMLYRNSST